MPFLILAAVASLLPVWLELATEHTVHLDGVLRVWVLLLPSLIVVGVLCWQPFQRIRAAVAAVVISSLVMWLLPLHPREQFANDVGRLQVGMSVAEVEAIMAKHVSGATGVTDFFDTVRREHPFANKSYYEAHGEHHSFDNFCLVTWSDGHATAIQLSED